MKFRRLPVERRAIIAARDGVQVAGAGIAGISQWIKVDSATCEAGGRTADLVAGSIAVVVEGRLPPNCIDPEIAGKRIIDLDRRRRFRVATKGRTPCLPRCSTPKD